MRRLFTQSPLTPQRVVDPKEGVGPSQAARVVGLKGLPSAGDLLSVVRTEQRAKELAKLRSDHQTWKLINETEETNLAAPAPSGGAARAGGAAMAEAKAIAAKAAAERGEEENTVVSVPAVIKVDSHGSIAAIHELLGSLPKDKVD